MKRNLNRKNRWLNDWRGRATAVLLALICVCALGGCSNAGGDAESGHQKATAGADGMVFTQTEQIGVCTDTDKSGYSSFESYLEVAEPFALTPGFKELLVSQGMDQHEGTGNIYMSGYFKRDQDNPFADSGNPSAIAVMNSEGELIGEYVMRNADGSVFTSHMGGVAVSDDTIYVSASQKKDSDGNVTYWIAAISLDKLEAEGHHEVTVDKLYQVPVQPSYMNYSNGTLWIGNFFLRSNDSYQAPVTIGEVDAVKDRTSFGGYILGYDLSGQGSARLETEGGECAMPDADKVFATTDRIQGMTRLADGRIVLSQSYGRKNNSALMVYDPAKAETATISIAGAEYTCVMLEKKTCQEYSYTMMPMSEGITVKTDGNGLEVLVLYESGAVLYSGDGTYDSNAGVYRTDYIWKVTIPESAGDLPEDNGAQKETEEKQPETTGAQKETEEKQPETTEAQPETTAEPETEGNQSGNPGSNVGNGKYAPMAESDFNTAVANSVTTVTVNFGPELTFYLDANFAILAVEALEWQAEWIVGEQKYVYLPMQFGEGLADVTVKGWDMLIGGIGIEKMTLTVKTQLADVEAMREKYYQEMEIMGMMSNQLVAKKSHRFVN